MQPDIHIELNEAVKRIHYPAEKMEWRNPVKGRGFFPVCSGTLCDNTDFSAVDTMVLGQDFGTADYYDRVVESNAKCAGSGEMDLNGATLRGLECLLLDIRIHQHQVFSTNAYPGVRVSGKMTGPCPGRNDLKYVDESIGLLTQTLRYLPTLKRVFVLGLETAAFVKKAFPDGVGNWQSCRTLRDYCTAENVSTLIQFEGRTLELFFILHPSFNLVNRSKLGYREITLLETKLSSPKV